MNSSARREKIEKLIHKNGEVSLKSLEQTFPDISSMTLRRDLIFLEKKGDIIRVRGGAKSIKGISKIQEDIYTSRMTENIEAKKLISKIASQFLETGRSIYIDSGTTTMCLAEILPDENFSILTSAPNIGIEIIKKHLPTVTLIGGQLSRNNISASGVNSLSFLKNINIDIAFIATSGFSLESGFTGGDYNECELKRFVIKKARKVILLMDISKIGKNMPFTFANLKEIDILICDKKIDKTIIEKMNKYGVKIYYP